MSSISAARILPPINVLFTYMERKAPVTVWLFEQTDCRIEGVIEGFDEFMNLVLGSAVEVRLKSGERRELGEILLKGDNITLVSSLEN